MTPEQASKLRKRDEVLVRCVITGTDLAPEPNGVLVRAAHDPHGSNLYVRIEAVREVLPRPLEAGDRVTTEDSALDGTIIAVADGEAWVRWPASDTTVEPLYDLQRVEDQ